MAYFLGEQKVAEAASAPWGAAWANPQPGQHTITAKALDAAGQPLGEARGVVTVGGAARLDNETGPGGRILQRK